MLILNYINDLICVVGKGKRLALRFEVCPNNVDET